MKDLLLQQVVNWRKFKVWRSPDLCHFYASKTPKFCQNFTFNYKQSYTTICIVCVINFVTRNIWLWIYEYMKLWFTRNIFSNPRPWHYIWNYDKQWKLFILNLRKTFFYYLFVAPKPTLHFLKRDSLTCQMLTIHLLLLVFKVHWSQSQASY